MTRLNPIPALFLLICTSPAFAQDFGEIQRRGLEPINRGQTIIRQERIIIREREVEREEEPVAVKHSSTFEPYVVPQAPEEDQFQTMEEFRQEREMRKAQSAQSKEDLKKLFDQIGELME